MKLILPNWPAPAHIHACTTTKMGWTGKIEERDQLPLLLNAPNNIVWLNQIHSNKIIQADMPTNKEADASYTKNSHLVCVVETADCLPVLICNKQGTQIAAIHAGWRGLSNGIIENALDQLKENPQDLLVWLGPGIGPTHFEVGKDVYDAFVDKQPESKRAFQPHKTNKWLANLFELAKIRLNLREITNIYGGDYCTFSDPSLFYSYRRDKGKTGRMASLIWIAEK